MERPTGVDLHFLARCFDRIWNEHLTASQRCHWDALVYHWRHPRLEHLAEKSLECENAPRGCGRLLRLVLERAFAFAKSAPECSLRRDRPSCMFYPDLLYFEIFVERGI